MRQVLEDRKHVDATNSRIKFLLNLTSDFARDAATQLKIIAIVCSLSAFLGRIGGKRRRKRSSSFNTFNPRLDVYAPMPRAILVAFWVFAIVASVGRAFKEGLLKWVHVGIWRAWVECMDKESRGCFSLSE